jgi:hypothetical protein
MAQTKGKFAREMVILTGGNALVLYKQCQSL